MGKPPSHYQTAKKIIAIAKATQVADGPDEAVLFSAIPPKDPNLFLAESVEALTNVIRAHRLLLHQAEHALMDARQFITHRESSPKPM